MQTPNGLVILLNGIRHDQHVPIQARRPVRHQPQHQILNLRLLVLVLELETLLAEVLDPDEVRPLDPGRITFTPKIRSLRQ